MTADRTNDTGILPKGFNSPAHCGQKVNFTLISLKVEVFSAANIRFTGRGAVQESGISLEGCAPGHLQVPARRAVAGAWAQRSG